MPLYEVEYSIPLTKIHKDDLAAAITKIHHLAYGIPSFFVSVKLTDGSKNENYSGGKIVSCPLIQHSRNRLVSKKADYNQPYLRHSPHFRFSHNSRLQQTLRISLRSLV